MHHILTRSCDYRKLHHIFTSKKKKRFFPEIKQPIVSCIKHIMTHHICLRRVLPGSQVTYTSLQNMHLCSSCGLSENILICEGATGFLSLTKRNCGIKEEVRLWSFSIARNCTFVLDSIDILRYIST